MSYDPVDIEAQAQAEADAQAKRRNAKDTEESDLCWLMSSKRGRRIVWRLLDQAGVFRLSFNTNAMTMAFNEGNRNYGNRLLTLVNAHCPELFTAMLKDQKDGRLNDASRSANPN